MSEHLETAGAPGPPIPDNRILVISRIGCPPPIGGNRTRMAALLREMRRLGYQVHFAGIRMSAEEKSVTQSMVDEYVWNFNYVPPPMGVARLRASLAYRFRRWLRHFRFMEEPLDETIYDHWLGEARDLQQQRQYSRVLVSYVYHSKFFLAFPDPCLRILDTHDAFSNRQEQLRAGKVDGYWRSHSPEDEKRGLLRAQRIIAIQEPEAAYFRRLLGPRSESEVQTIGHLADPISDFPPPVSFPALGYLGSNTAINVRGLQWFLREVWPHVRSRLPKAELWVAGTVCDKCEPSPGVQIRGKISHLADFYRECPVLINPVRAGTGISIKTIEALMHGRPVVSTRVGVEGMEAFLGHGLFVCDSADEFANTAVNLLSNLSQAQQFGEEALRLAQSYMAENRRVLAAVLSK
jgi:glycosyltransferase involved in cell wall biosynthesis